MRKVHVSENPDFTARYPAEQPCRMEVVGRSGERFYAETSHPKGHPMNPLTDAELEDKFHGLAERRPCEGPTQSRPGGPVGFGAGRRDRTAPGTVPV